MAKKLYVGGVSYNTTEKTLHDLFASVGEVEFVNLITDRDTGRSKGFAFVEMVSEDDAQEAIEKFDGYELDGRRVTVNEARPQGQRNNNQRRGGGGGGGQWNSGGGRGNNRW